MVWYPSVDDVIDMKIDALDLSGTSTHTKCWVLQAAFRHYSTI